MTLPVTTQTQLCSFFSISASKVACDSTVISPNVLIPRSAPYNAAKQKKGTSSPENTCSWLLKESDTIHWATGGEAAARVWNWKKSWAQAATFFNQACKCEYCLPSVIVHLTVKKSLSYFWQTNLLNDPFCFRLNIADVNFFHPTNPITMLNNISYIF